MIKSMVFFKRKPGMGVEAFRRYWLEQHPRVVLQLPGIRRYVQDHPTPSAYDAGREPAYDGVAEVWFDDWEALRAAGRGPAWQAVAADEANFMDPSSRRLLVVEEHAIVPWPRRGA